MIKRTSEVITLIIRILVVVALVAIGIIIYQTCAGAPIIQKIDRTQPDISRAPFEVTTVTHILYAKEAVHNEDGSVIIAGWYERINGKWVYHDSENTLPAKLRPRINRR